MDETAVIAGYNALLASVGERAGDIRERPVITHWPHVGSAYRGLVIVGQAVYGWGDDYRADHFQTEAGRQESIACQSGPGRQARAFGQAFSKAVQVGSNAGAASSAKSLVKPIPPGPDGLDVPDRRSYLTNCLPSAAQARRTTRDTRCGSLVVGVGIPAAYGGIEITISRVDLGRWDGRPCHMGRHSTFGPTAIWRLEHSEPS